MTKKVLLVMTTLAALGVLYLLVTRLARTPPPPPPVASAPVRPDGQTETPAARGPDVIEQRDGPPRLAIRIDKGRQLQFPTQVFRILTR